MRPSACLWALLALTLPSAAFAQQFEGLDLSEDAPKQEATEAPETATEPPPAAETFTPPPAETSEQPAAPLGHLREVEVTSEDRVKSVQLRGFMKDGRFDITPMVFTTLNDGFFPKYGPGARISYHLHESFGMGVRFFQYNKIPSDNPRLAKRQLHSRLPSVQPDMSLSLDLLWSPIYGKVSLFNAIRHFDIFVVGGAGAVMSQTSEEDGPHLSTHIGLGQRFSVNDFLAVDLSVLESIYSDRPDGANKAVLQHLLSLNLGLSVFLPFSSDYQEP